MRTVGMPAVLWLALMSTSCGRVTPALASEKPTPSADRITAEIRLGSPTGMVNRRILGNNVQWVDRGDELLSSDGSRFDPRMLNLVRDLGPTVLRYPGGSQSDTFAWRSGNGPIGRRGTSEHFHRRQHEQVLFGTEEFLALCRHLRAEPLITVNATTGSPQEAADWVRFVNRPMDGVLRGPVHFWEVGNEPYLKEDVQPTVAVEPKVFASRVNAFIRAMRQVDDTIAIGIPLRRDRLGAIPAVAFPGFADTVLREIDEPFNFVALHNAYLPLIADRGARYSPEDLFRASMAAYTVVEEDLVQTRQLLERYHPGRKLPFAITEYNAIYTLQGVFDNHIASLGAALYVADLLRMFASRDDILMANFWSLTGNWLFGAVSNERQLRPAYHVLRAYSEMLRGERLDLELRGPTFDSPAIGAVPATRGVPTIVALATSYSGRTSLLVMNKSVHMPAAVAVENVSGSIRSATGRELSDAGIFDPSHKAGALGWRVVPIDTKSRPLRLSLAPHSLLWVEIETGS